MNLAPFGFFAPNVDSPDFGRARNALAGRVVEFQARFNFRKPIHRLHRLILCNLWNLLLPNMKQRIRLAALLLFFLSSLLFSTSLTHSQRAPNVEQRVNALLARMTLEEKLGQLQQLDGEGWQLSSGTSRPDSQGLLGSTLNVRGAQRTNQVQVAMNESRLKIPFSLASTSFMAIARSFRFRLAKRVVGILRWLAERSASVAAQEANNVGLRWTFAPMVDIARDPRWGRITEGAVKIRFSVQHLRERACVGFRVRTTARRTRYSRVRNTGSLTAMQKEVATTTPPISLALSRNLFSAL